MRERARSFFNRLALAALVFSVLLGVFAPVQLSASPGEKGEKPARPFAPAQIERSELPPRIAELSSGELECMQSAEAAVLIEAGSRQLLLSKSPDLRLPMASTTKTMTALVVLENCSPDELVTVPKEAVGVEGSSLYLRLGERLSVRDLLYGLMLKSGNDAAVALALHVGGSVEGFIGMMNARAELMGLKNTHFVTPNGLHDDEHYTSAYELAVIGAAALENDELRRIVSTRYHRIETSERVVTVQNKNSMLTDYDGCIGIKTGYTSAAGRCLLFAAERDGMTLVGVVLNCRPMFEVAPEMLDYGFESYALTTAIRAGDELTRCEVKNGVEATLPLVAGENVVLPVRKGESLDTELAVELFSQLTAPVREGDTLGSAVLLIGGREAARAPLVAGAGIPARNFLFYLRYIVNILRQG